MDHVHTGNLKPGHCFCSHTAKELVKWIKLRYLENIPTVQLINSTDDPEEREIISLVGLLDVEEDKLLAVMSDVEKTEKHIIECRSKSHEILERLKKKLNKDKNKQ